MSDINYDLHKREGYSDASPYPEIKVVEPNKYYLQLIRDDYAGIISEFTAINQYLYHYFVLKDYGKELGELLENVAISEMLHMEILAEVIILLGGNPDYKGGASTKCGFWNGSFVNYGCNLCHMLQADIKAEHQAIRCYQKHIKAINDPYIKAILHRIILDENVHLELFKNAYNAYCVK